LDSIDDVRRPIMSETSANVLFNKIAFIRSDNLAVENSIVYSRATLFIVILMLKWHLITITSAFCYLDLFYPQFFFYFNLITQKWNRDFLKYAYEINKNLLCYLVLAEVLWIYFYNFSFRRWPFKKIMSQLKYLNFNVLKNFNLEWIIQNE